MCGFYSLTAIPEDLVALLGCDGAPEEALRGYIAPGTDILVCRIEDGARAMAVLSWGLVPGWAKEIGTGKPLINARAESVLEKPSFRDAMARRRCLVPASLFYEWQGERPGHKQAYMVAPADGAPFAMAGLWEAWRGPDGRLLESAAIVTVAANERLAAIHPRMPAVIHARDYAAWLNVDGVPAHEAARLLRPADDTFFTAEPVELTRPRKPAASEAQLSLL